MVPRWLFLATFCVLHSREPRAACFRPASEIRTKCVEVWQTSNLRRLRLGEEKKKKEERKKKKQQGKNIMVCPIPYRATITNDRMKIYRDGLPYTIRQP